MTWQEILKNGVPRRAPTPTVLASIVEAATTGPTTTRAFVTITGPTTATAAIRVGPLYICNPERLSETSPCQRYSYETTNLEDFR